MYGGFYIGQKINMLTIIKVVYKDINSVKFLCECECGNQKEIFDSSLRSGTISCGCKKKEIYRANWKPKKIKKAQELVGTIINNRKILEFKYIKDEPDKKMESIFDCQCIKCGTIYIELSEYKIKTRKCKCEKLAKKERNRKRKVEALKGQKIGTVEIIDVKSKNTRNPIVETRCVKCGNIKVSKKSDILYRKYKCECQNKRLFKNFTEEQKINNLFRKAYNRQNKM